MQSLRSRERAHPGVVPEPSEQDDAQLVRASQQGNLEAFALLVRKHQRRIFQLCLNMLTEEHDASESIQEAFVAAWQGLPGFRDEPHFSTWLYRIAYQCCLRRLERRKREHARHSAGQAEQVLGGIRSEKQGAETNERQDLQTFVQEQVEHLPLTYRTVLILRHLHNQPYEEIASIISMPLGTVKIRLFRARTLLKERLAGTAPLVMRESMVETPLTENEEIMHTSGPFPFQGGGQASIPDQQETDGFSQHQQAWLEQHQWVQHRRRWLDRQHLQLTQRESALIQGDAAGERRSG